MIQRRLGRSFTLATSLIAIVAGQQGCSSDSPAAKSCAPGEVLLAGACVPSACPAGEMLVGGACVAAVSASFSVTPAGTAVQLSNATVIVPAGAVPADTTIGVSVYTAPAGAADGTVAAVRFEPDGLVLARPITLALPLAEKRTPGDWLAGRSLDAGRESGTRPEYGVVGPTGDYLIFQQTHFSGPKFYGPPRPGWPYPQTSRTYSADQVDGTGALIKAKAIEIELPGETDDVFDASAAGTPGIGGCDFRVIDAGGVASFACRKWAYYSILAEMVFQLDASVPAATQSLVDSFFAGAESAGAKAKSMKSGLRFVLMDENAVRAARQFMLGWDKHATFKNTRAAVTRELDPVFNLFMATPGLVKAVGEDYVRVLAYQTVYNDVLLQRLDALQDLQAAKGAESPLFRDGAFAKALAELSEDVRAAMDCDATSKLRRAFCQSKRSELYWKGVGATEPPALVDVIGSSVLGFLNDQIEQYVTLSPKAVLGFSFDDAIKIYGSDVLAVIDDQIRRGLQANLNVQLGAILSVDPVSAAKDSDLRLATRRRDWRILQMVAFNAASFRTRNAASLRMSNQSDFGKNVWSLYYNPSSCAEGAPEAVADWVATPGVPGLPKLPNPKEMLDLLCSTPAVTARRLAAASAQEGEATLLTKLAGTLEAGLYACANTGCAYAFYGVDPHSVALGAQALRLVGTDVSASSRVDIAGCVAPTPGALQPNVVTIEGSPLRMSILPITCTFQTPGWKNVEVRSAGNVLFGQDALWVRADTNGYVASVESCPALGACAAAKVTDALQTLAVQAGVSTTVKISGVKLPSGLTLQSGGCSTVAAMTATASEVTIRCGVGAAGTYPAKLVDGAGTSWLDFTIEAGAASPVVDALTPLAATTGTATTFAVTGSALPSTLAFSMPGCTPVTTGTNDGASARFTCTPTIVGAQSASVFAKAGDATPLKQFTVSVSDAPVVIPGSSCAGGLTCGAVSCCDAKVLPGGTFPMGRATSGADACPAWTTCGSNDQPEHNATVSSFSLDTYEVTVGRFRKFVAGYPGNKPVAGAGSHPKIAGSGWQSAWDASLAATQAALITSVKCNSTYQTWTDAAGANENKPMNCLDWYTSFAFCAWDGGRLPTEAEWEYASAGGSENRVLPWGSTQPDKTLASYGCLFNGTSSCEAADLPVVGSTPLGASRWGQQDLAGSLWEWNLDWYTTYSGAASNDYANVANPNSGSYRVYRGGGFDYDAGTLLAADRNYISPTYRGNLLGVRCARTP